MSKTLLQQAKDHNPRLRVATVLSVENTTPNMRRVIFGGDDLAAFPEGAEGHYIKLAFLDAPGADPADPVLRTYSIRAHDAKAGTLTVDFAVHADTGGVAIEWVMQAQPGDELGIMGPGKVKMPSPDATWYLIAADMTGQPAALCALEGLPADAKGHIVLEIPTEADKPELHVPAGMEAHWVVNPHPADLKPHLLNKIKDLAWQDGAPFVWTACEFDTMRALRTYYRTDRNVERDAYYLSSYWRSGRSEDQHKIDKRKDATANAA